MFDLPPQQIVEEIERPPEIVVCYGLEQTFTYKEEKELKQCAEVIRGVFDDGFQWDDLSDIVTRSFAFVDHYPHFDTEKKREGVIFIIDHLIDITDTPYLPDAITDPIMKTFVPAYVDLMQWALHFKQDHLSEESALGTIEELWERVEQFAEENFDLDKMCEEMKSSLIFISKQIHLTNAQKKDAAFGVASFMVDVAFAPLVIGPILNPIAKILMRPVINLVIDAVFEESD